MPVCTISTTLSAAGYHPVAAASLGGVKTLVDSGHDGGQGIAGGVVKHLLGLPNVSVEEWPRVADALALHTEGLDFADALHLLASSHCTEFVTFDDHRFARRAKRLGTKPAVVVPAR